MRKWLPNGNLHRPQPQINYKKVKKDIDNSTEKCYNIYVSERQPLSQIKESELIKMAKRKNNNVTKVVVDKNAAQFARTAANLARKGKTNKKLGRNPKAKKYAIA